MKKTIQYESCGLEYVWLVGVPTKKSKFGEVIDADLAEIEHIVAAEIIKQGIPIRGREVMFLRKCLGLSLEKFAKALDLTAPAVLKWEKAEKKRLHPINEVAVRSFLAEKLKLKLSGHFSSLVGEAETPAHLNLKVG